jgi:hypothetical protein
LQIADLFSRQRPMPEGDYFVTSSRSLFSFVGDAPFKGRISIELFLVPEAILLNPSTAENFVFNAVENSLVTFASLGYLLFLSSSTFL